eukprot:IDg4175t1
MWPVDYRLIASKGPISVEYIPVLHYRVLGTVCEAMAKARTEKVAAPLAVLE